MQSPGGCADLDLSGQRATAVVATGHTLALQSELDAITARPVAVVASELAQATSRNASAFLAVAKRVA